MGLRLQQYSSVTTSLKRDRPTTSPYHKPPSQQKASTPLKQDHPQLPLSPPPASSIPNMNAGILDLNPHLGKSVRVTFQGGREVVGILRGFDPMVNVVIDDSVEHLRSENDPYKASGKTRKLGRVVCRGNNVTMCAPEEGYESIANPFTGAEEEDVEMKE